MNFFYSSFRLIFVFSTILLLNLIPCGLAAETVYMTDDQVLNGTIISENENEIHLQTKYQKKIIERKYILKIVHDSALEPVRIVTVDNELINGFLVSRDSAAIVYRISKESSEDISIQPDRVKSIILGTPPTDNINILTSDGKIVSGELIYQDRDKIIIHPEDQPDTEQTISKSDIKKISYDTIRIYDTEYVLSGGLNFPLNTGGAELGNSYTFFAGYLINNPFINKTRILFEGGYLNPKGKSRSDLQMIPVAVNLLYYYPMKHVDIIPRAGAGACMLFYKNREGDAFFGIKPTFFAGLGCSYILMPNRLFLMSFVDYCAVYDSGSTLSGLFFTIGVSYRVFK